MRNVFCVFVLIFAACKQALGQKMPEDYFQEGKALFEAKKYESAVASFRHIVQNNPRNELFPRAVYNIGYCYFLANRSDSATSVFKVILKSNFNERDKSGGGIMDDPYANYRHRASELLSEIYYRRKMYDTALYYFAISDTVYPYLHFCGNEYAANDVRTALWYSTLYQKLGFKDQAIQSLLPAVFISLADNAKVISELKALLRKKDGLKNELDIALSNIYSKNIRKKDDGYKVYCFKFLNTEIAVPNGYQDNGAVFDKQKAIEDVRKSGFYAMIVSL
jgi:tetratricopeptide (TPR) repeat protein